MPLSFAGSNTDTYGEFNQLESGAAKVANNGRIDLPHQRVGLDIGSHTIKGVEVVERASEISVRALGSVSVLAGDSRERSPDRSALIQAVKSLWSAARFESKDVVIGLAPDMVYLKWLRVECSDDDELDHLARSAAVRGCPFPPEDAIPDYRALSRIDRGNDPNVYHVMLAAASASAVNSALDVAERAGLNVLAVDAGVAAALRSLETERLTGGALWTGQPRAHCVLGASNTSIGVVRHGALEFARTVPVGGNDITLAAAEHLGVSPAEAEHLKTSPDARLTEEGLLSVFHRGTEAQAPCWDAIERLAREITRSLRFFSTQFAEGSYLGMTGATTVSGGGSLLKGIDACLRRHGVEVTGIVNPFAGFSVEDEGSGVERAGGRSAVYTTAMGLAIWDYWERAAQAGPTPAETDLHSPLRESA